MVSLRNLLSLAGLVALGVAQDSSEDLGSVLADNDDLSTFYELIQKYPNILLQLPSYDGVTIIAPSNEAFENIPYTALNEIWDPEDEATTVPLLQYHILRGTVSTSALEEGPTFVRSTLLTSDTYTNVTSGQSVLINKQSGDTVIFTTSMGTRCTLETGDIAFRGGLIQVVDNLLIPPARLGETSHAFQIPSFLGGLYAAELMPDVAERKNVTIFAPRDEAFDIVGGTLEGLDVEELARVMGYHIVPDQVLVSSSLTNGTRLETLAEDASGTNQQSLVIRQAGNNKYVNSAQIIQPDILIANGILHLIANVLNPDVDAVQPDPEQPTQPAVFPVSTAEDVFTSALPCSVDCPVTTTTPASSPSGSATASTETDGLFTSTSDGPAPRCTAQYAGAALGMLGVGAGLAML